MVPPVRTPTLGLKRVCTQILIVAILILELINFPTYLLVIYLLILEPGGLAIYTSSEKNCYNKLIQAVTCKDFW